MSYYPPEFTPLNAPRIAPTNPGPVTPVNWFQEIAPRLPERTPAYPIEEEADALPGQARVLKYRNVEELVQEAQRKQMEGVPDPPEIVEMRHRAALETQQLIEQALNQAQELEQQAKEEGYKDGYNRGYADGQQEAVQFLVERADAERAAYQEDISAFLSRIEAERQRLWEELEPQIVGLVFDLAKQVIKQEVQASRTVAISMIRNVLRRVSDSGALRIRVSPEDLEQVRDNRAEFMTMLDGIPHLEIVEDRRIGEGGCIVDTESGNIDARIETQLDEVADTLTQMLSQQDKAA